MLAGCAFVGWNGNLLRVPSGCVGVGRRTDLAPSLTSGRPPFLLGRWGALPAQIPVWAGGDKLSPALVQKCCSGA